MNLEVSIFDKVKVVLGIYSKVYLVNGLKSKILTFLNPLDAVRYFEIPNLWKFIKNQKLEKMRILDVSSPHQMSMLLHGTNNELLRINTDPKEEFLINHCDNLQYKHEDATSLTLPENSFDLVYSISVIEHIHNDYLKAIGEMLRVLKPGGHLYLSFPLDADYSEVWLDYEDYPGQFSKDGKYFFQYNFNKEKIVKEILGLGNLELVHQDSFWEKNPGDFDKMIGQIKTRFSFKPLNPLWMAFINFFWGLTLFNQNKKDNAKIGNISLVLRKS